MLELRCASAAELKQSGSRLLHSVLAIGVKGRGVSAAPLVGFRASPTGTDDLRMFYLRRGSVSKLNLSLLTHYTYISRLAATVQNESQNQTLVRFYYLVLWLKFERPQTPMASICLDRALASPAS